MKEKFAFGGDIDKEWEGYNIEIEKRVVKKRPGLN
jgi:hypothetical protein